jgi:hypothetical protein
VLFWGASAKQEETMMLRIIHGKLKPGTWEAGCGM